MVTKGIITSIDFNGNTCQVRIPLFETAGNDPITGTAIVSNTPGSYNGYKVGDVVLVAFEDGKMQNPVIVGKLYLGAAKEKQDPRGTINVETTTASKSASLPADAVLTANVDSNVPNTNTPFGSLASIANNLNSLNTDVNQLDRFTRNQFNSVITDVNNQGEQLRSEIKQTASNIEANVVHTHKDGSQDALGWDLTTDSWKINAQDTVNGKVKDINIVTIDRNGMSVAGDLKLSGYPRNITVLYAKTGSSENYPTPLYNFTEAEFPTSFPSGDEDKDKTWYYGKYIKITGAGEEKYILVFKENFEYYSITVGTTKAYNREVNSKVWSTETPKRDDGYYIWQWTHTEIYSFDGDKWDEQDDDKVVCITGADGKDGAPGKDGYNTVTVMLYKRSKTSISGEQISTDLYYKFSDQKLYTDDGCADEYILPTGWSYTISGAGDSGDGDLYCIAAVAHSNTDSDSIPASEWVGPTLYVENGEPTITLTIKNDFDSVPCDFDGNPSYSAQDWIDNTSHTIQVLEGQTPQAFNVIDSSSDEQIPSTGYAVVYKPDDSITYVVDPTDETLKSFTAHIEGLTADSANVLYTLYKNGTAIDEARFAATKLKAGAPGDPAVDYDILFSSGTIKVSKTGDKTPRTINVNFKKTVGQAEPVDFSGKYKVFIDNGTEPTSYGTADSIVLATSEAVSPQIDVSNAKNSIIVELYTTDGNTKLESETIDVVADGTDGTSVAQLILYKRSTEIPSGPASDGKWTYNAADGSLTCSNTATWSKSIPSGTAPCYESHAAVLVTGLGTTTVTTWSEPAKFVENGADGQPGVYIKEVKQWYKLVAKTDNDPTKPTNDIVEIDENGNPTHTTNEEWSDIPLDAINDMNLWTSLESIFSDDTPEKRHIEFSDPVKDAAYALAQGKTTNYYSPTEPIYNIKKGDCWFDTGYVRIDTPTTKTGYLGKFIVSTTGNISVKADETDSTRYIPDAAGSTKLIKITPDNIDKGLFTVKTKDTAGTDAYETGNLKQWDGETWIDLAGESVTNKLTAKYINALDITAKKITVLDKSNNNEPLFEADGINGNGSVKIANFNVNQTGLYSGTHNHIGSTDDGVYLGIDGISIGSNFKVKAGSVIISDYTKSTIKKYRKIEYDNETEAAAKYADWTNWDSDKWLSTIPGRDNGLYIWEWTKEEKGNGTFVDLGRVCITGAKGDPGDAGANPHVGENGNWWIGDSDTGVKAEGTDGHTPVITIGENGNWYIDGKDTGVLAKGTPGEPGAQGIGISECKTYYSLSNTTSPTGPETGDSNIVDTPDINKWSESPQAFNKNEHQGYSYWTVERRVYTNGAVVWGTPVKASMLSIDFIDSLGITAKKLLVTNSNGTLLDAGWSDDNMVTIGGFTVDSNRLYAGNPGTDDSIEIAKVHNLIAYKSNNQGVASSRAVSKITVNKDITNLTVYIRSYAESNFDYTMISNPNVSSYPTAYSSSDVKAHTRSNQNSSSALTGYTKVEYYDLKQNDYIYIVYSKDISNNAGADTGYFLIPETAVISIETVNGTGYTFERDTSLDTKEAGASLKVGSNFSVDSTGAIKSTSGTIGKLAIDGDGLSYGSTFKIDPTVDSWGSSEKQKATVVASSTLVQNTLILPGQSKRYQDEVAYYWPAFDKEGFKVLYTADWTGTDKPYKLGEYDLKDLAGIPIVSNYDHSMTRAESLACYGEDHSGIFGWGAPIIYANRHINIGSDWVEVDLSSSFNGSIRKILTVVCTTYVQPTKNTNSTSTTPTSKPNQSGNLFVSYDDYSNGKFWIRSNTEAVTVSILAIGVPVIAKTY